RLRVASGCERAPPLALPAGGVPRPEPPASDVISTSTVSAHASVLDGRDRQLVWLSITGACASSARHTAASNRGSKGRKLLAILQATDADARVVARFVGLARLYPHDRIAVPRQPAREQAQAIGVQLGRLEIERCERDTGHKQAEVV